MTESRQRGVGQCSHTEQQVASQISWMDEGTLTRKTDELWAELDSARHDFTTDLPWHPNNAYHLTDWWEQLAKWYAMRARLEGKREARRLAKAGAA